jgi:hypothetical protein
MKHPSAILLSSIAITLTACATASTPDADAPAAHRDLNKADAIASARNDAQQSYGKGWGTQVDAQYQGGFWVVQLYGAGGYRLRYAISARDGSIRERNMMQ